MKKIWPAVKVLILGIFLLSSLLIAVRGGTRRAVAAPQDPPGPDRYAPAIVDYTLYEWWMAEWEDNEVFCSIPVEHEGQPTPDEIYVECGSKVYNTWITQPPCIGSNKEENRALCKGFYIYLVSATPKQKEIAVPLPPPEVWLALPNCTPTATSTHICTGNKPKLRLIGMEPIPDQNIIRLAGKLNGEPFTCDQVAACNIALVETDEEGAEINFWAYSSYGDSSEIFSASLRVLPAPAEGKKPRWYVDVLSPQWAGTPLLSCAQTWEVFPPVDSLPAWLTTPENPEDLATNIPYDYLAGKLISQGLVDVSGCPGGGLLPSGFASVCGSRAAQPAVEAWQNQFDSLILTTSKDTDIPAQLLKNLFSHESQFWPGAIFGLPDVGLGQLTENGADTVLMWNPSFYRQFCPTVLDNKTCNKGYLKIKESERETLRSSLVDSVNAVCYDCPLGIDLDKAHYSVEIFAQTLLANCEQTGQIVRNASKLSPGAVSTYEELWKITLANYNAGPGCLSFAVFNAYKAGETLTWDSVAAQLTPVCQGAIDYVTEITK